jgi:glyoxylase-like metal-dependent hydrolase (beta-lactamase superfamily II)
MSRTFLLRFSAGIVFLLGAWMAYTQNQGNQPPQLKVNKVKEDLYEIEGDGGNVAVYVTNEGLILIDDKFDRDHDAIVAQIKSFSNQPVKYIISTHYHEDHSGGNGKFLSTAEVISTANARANIVNRVQSNRAGDVQPARVTFTEETAVFLGGKEVRAHHFGRGHTNGDAVIYFPALRTIHTGDMMAGTSPLIDYPGGGSLVEWPKTLDAVMKDLDFDTVIPGHGPVTTKAGLMTYRNNVDKLRVRATSLVREGKSQDDLAKVMTAEYGWMPGSLNFQWSLPGMMKELK